MWNKVLVIGVTAMILAACQTPAGKWTAGMWNGQSEQTLDKGNYNLVALPISGQGFRLKFAIKTNGNFGVSSAGAEAVPDEIMEAAAIEAAPEGCTYVGLERTADGGAIAEFDCVSVSSEP